MKEKLLKLAIKYGILRINSKTIERAIKDIEDNIKTIEASKFPKHKFDLLQ